MFIQTEMTQRKRWTDVLTVPNIHTLLLFFILSSAVLLILKLHDHQESIEIALTLGDIAPVQMSPFFCLLSGNVGEADVLAMYLR